MRTPEFPQQAANDSKDEIVAKTAVKPVVKISAKINVKIATKLAPKTVNKPVTKTTTKTVVMADAKIAIKTDADDRDPPKAKLLGDDYGRDVAHRLFASMHNADKARLVRLQAMRKGFVASKKEWTMREVAYAQLRKDASDVRREAAQNLLDGAAYYKDYFQGQLDYLYANPIDCSQARRTALDHAAKMLNKSRDDVRRMFADFVTRQG